MFRRWFGGGFQNHYLRGMDQFNRGDFEEALEEFDHVVAQSDDDSHPYTTLARFYRAEALSRLGSRALAQGDDASALALLDRALEEQPGYPDLHFRRGVALLRGDRPSEAEHASRRALTLNHQFVEARVLLALSFRAQDRPHLEQRELETLAAGNQMHPLLAEPISLEGLSRHVFREEDRRARILAAERQFVAGRWEESRVQLSELVAENPGFADLRLRLAAVCFRMGDLDVAREHADAALDRNPRFADALVLRGAIAACGGEWGEALTQLTRGRARGEASPFADSVAALALIALGRLDEAGPLLARLGEATDASAPVFALAAAVQLQTGDVDDALEQYAQMLKTSSEEAIVVDAVSAALAASDLERARRFASRLPARDASTDALLARVEVLRREGKLEVCAEILETALTDAPTEARLRTMAARVALDARAFGTALRHLEAGATSWPGADGLRSEALAHLDQPEAALAALETERNAPRGPVEMELARLFLLRRLNRADAAAAALAHLRRVAPLDPRVRLQEMDRWRTGLVAHPPLVATAS